MSWEIAVFIDKVSRKIFAVVTSRPPEDYLPNFGSRKTLSDKKIDTLLLKHCVVWINMEKSVANHTFAFLSLT